jgi:hypothetical protein
VILLFVLCVGAVEGLPERPNSGSSQYVNQAEWNGGRIYTISPPNIFRHNIGLLDLMVTNVAVFGNPGWIDQHGAGWRGGEYLYGAGIWIGAIASDDLPHVSTGLFEVELRPSLEPVDTIYESYEGIPGGNRLGFSDDADDDGDGLIDEDFHNGKDDDLDGAIDEDFGAISEQMFSCEYWDYTPEAIDSYPDHCPLNVRVRQKSLAWSIDGLDEFVGVELEVINDGAETLRDVYLGMFMDADAGPRDHPGYYADDGGFVYLEDEILIDPTIDDCNEIPVRMEMAYVYDVPDGVNGASGGDVEGFFGLLYLGSTRDLTGRAAPPEESLHTAMIFNPDPVNDAERYEDLRSGTISDQPTPTPGDYRALVSVGPFPEFGPGESIRLHFAFVVGEGYYDTDTNTPYPDLGPDGEPSEHSLLANARRARLVYEGRWKDIDGLPETGIDGNETCIVTEPGEPFVWIDPCGVSADRTFNGAICEDPYSWVDGDCNPCTPNPFHEGCAGGGCEQLIHWYTPPAERPTSHMVATPDSPPPLLELRTMQSPSPPPMRFQVVPSQPLRCAVAVFDVTGRLVRDLGESRLPASVSEWVWDGRDQNGSAAPTGIYFVRVEGGHRPTSRQFVLVRR